MIPQSYQIINEAQISKLSQLRTSKLQNLEEHLKALINKKIRLEFEIKSLQKTIRAKGKLNSKSLKLSLGLEASELLSEEQIKSLKENCPEVLQNIITGDQASKEIIDLLLTENLITIEEAQDLSKIL